MVVKEQKCVVSEGISTHWCSCRQFQGFQCKILIAELVELKCEKENRNQWYNVITT